MKNIFKKIGLVFIGISLFFLNSCDELSQLTLNIPLPIEFYTSGTNTSLSETEYFCLSSYEEWRDNQDDVESAKFLTASYWTLDATPNLRGDLSFSLYNDFGGLLFTVSMGNVRAADYINTPYELQLNESQIQVLDNYLMDLAAQDKCFQSVLSISNITGDTNIQGQFELSGKVEIVLETEVNVE
jgi:hypothetical protein